MLFSLLPRRNRKWTILLLRIGWHRINGSKKIGPCDSLPSCVPVPSKTILCHNVRICNGSRLFFTFQYIYIYTFIIYIYIYNIYIYIFIIYIYIHIYLFIYLLFFFCDSLKYPHQNHQIPETTLRSKKRSQRSPLRDPLVLADPSGDSQRDPLVNDADE